MIQTLLSRVLSTPDSPTADLYFNNACGDFFDIGGGAGVTRLAPTVFASAGACLVMRHAMRAKRLPGGRRLIYFIDDAVEQGVSDASLPFLYRQKLRLVERAAARGEAARFNLPRPLKGRPGCDFSFSGLKTAVRHAVEALPGEAVSAADAEDLSAGFQAAVVDVIADRLGNAIAEYRHRRPEGGALVVAGGVAANRALRERLGRVAAAAGLDLAIPPPEICTDNAAMIAWAGIERLRLGLTDGLDASPRARWPLDPNAPPVTGTGFQKGKKR